MPQRTLSILPMPAKNNLWPKEGPQAIPMSFDFTLTGAYAVDLGIQQSQGKFSFVQTIYVDNSANTKVLSIAFDTLNQMIQVPGGMQGYFPVLVVTPPRLTITSAGGTTATVMLLNFPVAPAMWAGTGSALKFDANGNALVSDTALEAAISNGKVLAQQYVQGNADAVMPFFGGNEMRYSRLTAAGVAPVLAAQGAGIGWFLKYVDVWVSGNASLAAAGLLNIELRDNATQIGGVDVFLPAAAPATPGFGQTVLRLDNLNYNAKTANTPFNVNLSAALTSGNVEVNICWGQTTNVTP